MKYTTLFFGVLFVGCFRLDAMYNPAALVAAATTTSSEVSELVASLQQQLEEARRENAENTRKLEEYEELTKRLTGELAAHQEVLEEYKSQSTVPIHALDKNVLTANTLY